MLTIEVVAQVVVALSAGVVLAAVAINVALASAEPRDVERRRRGPVATASMLTFFVALWALVRWRIGVVPVDDVWARTALAAGGAVLVAAGALVNVLGRVALGRDWADHATVYRDQRLVDTGVFRLVRHPLYASLVWMFTGAALVYRNAAALAATLLVFLPAMVWRARLEERLLADRFHEYPRYRRRVGMLFPRPARAAGALTDAPTRAPGERR